MPSNLLIVESDINNVNYYESFLNESLKIPFSIINSFDSLEESLQQNNYSHLILNANIDLNWNSKFEHLITIPTLVISSSKNYEGYYVIEGPLSFEEVFNFLCVTSEFSCNTLNEYSLGDEEMFNELLTQIQIEFEETYSMFPQFIKNQNLQELKNRTHQISSKFSLLEMGNAYEIAREIDSNILNDPKHQLVNCQSLLVDFAIVLNQLKS